MSLIEYVRKRNFRKTAEPKGGRPASGKGHRFVIQKHAASRLHYDFRLELGGALKSWAVPKGVPYQKGERRLAVRVEDHPISYIDFEGTIPKGQYGGGTVMVWDTGTFEPLSQAPLKELTGGKLHFVLHGKKLHGEWYLVQLRGGDEWLLIKGGEDLRPVTAKADDTSAVSGKSMRALAKGAGRVWPARPAGSKTSKAGVAAIARTATRNPSAAKTRRRPVPKAAAPAAAMSTRGAARQAARAVNDRPVRLRVPRFVEPMKARLVATPPAGTWIYEIKLDGFRAIAIRDGQETRLRSRNDKDLSARFPEVVAAIDGLAVDDAILDGEIVAMDAKGRSSFQRLQAYDLGQERPPIHYHLFDLLWLNGQDLQALPLTERKARLEHLLKGVPPPLRFSVSLGNQPEVLLRQARKLGLEGLIGKRPDSEYEAGRRSGAWIKLKLHQEQEFVIGGYTPPGGSRTGFGALLVGVHAKSKLRFAGKVGTGFNTKLLRSLRERLGQLATPVCPFADLPEPRRGRYGQGVTAAEMSRCHWVKPMLVAQVKFAEWTRDGRLRQPVFLGLREDKSAREVVREAKA